MHVVLICGTIESHNQTERNKMTKNQKPVEPIKTIKRKVGVVKIDTTVKFYDHDFVDIRYYYEDKGTLKPSQKGIMLTHTEFRILANLFNSLNEDAVHGKRMRKIRKLEKSAKDEK